MFNHMNMNMNSIILILITYYLSSTVANDNINALKQEQEQGNEAIEMTILNSKQTLFSYEFQNHYDMFES